MRGLVAITLLTGLALPLAAQDSPAARGPAIAADGRLVVSIAGDLWVLPAAGPGAWGAGVQVTSGPAWDRDPAWTADGRLVFASDRAGAAADLWRVDARADATPERLTTSPDHDTEPAVAPDGTIAFVRGRGGDSDLWLRTPDGTETRLTTEPGPEREPSWTPDGTRLAYVTVRNGMRVLRVRPRTGGAEEAPLGERSVRWPRWSPDGTRLAFSTEGREAGVWVVGADGRYAQPVLLRAGLAAWTPDGERLVIAELETGDGGYNGDPDRLGERRAGDMFRGSGGLEVAAVPSMAAGVALTVSATPDRAALNGAAYDRVWTRLARLYYGVEGEAASLEARVRGERGAAAAWREAGRRHRAAAVSATSDTALTDAIWALVRSRPVSEGSIGRAGVSSAHPLATAAGLEVLAKGGNVVDAAIAVSLALGVVEPDASGIGGYGQMLIQLEGMTEPTSLEFMATVPAGAALGAVPADALPRSGPGMANVPGLLAGLEAAFRHGSGRLTWEELVAPAVRLAEGGYPVSDGLATTLRRERAELWRHEGSRALFFRNGEPLAEDDTVRNPALAETLRQVGRHGADAFYRGALAEAMVADLRAGGSLMTTADLAGYRAMERRPVRTSYRGNDIFSGPPPVTGGATLVARLNLLEQVPPGGSMVEDAAKLHAMLEAVKFQPSTTGRVHDPELWPVDVTPFESKDTAVARWRCYERESSAASNALSLADCGRLNGGSSDGGRLNGGGLDGGVVDGCLAEDRECRGTGTTAFVVADGRGNIVSVTQTLGTWGGNFYVSPGLGFLYNDKLRSYGSNPEAPNARLAGARHTTTITPTIGFRGTGAARRPWFGAGAAGNAWIGSAVYATVVGIIDEGLGAQQALELPRFLGTTRVQVEDAFAPRVIRELEAMGHVIERISLMGELRMGYGAAVVVRDGRVEAGGDPRRSGTGGVVR